MTRQEKRDLKEAARLVANLGQLHYELSLQRPDNSVSKRHAKEVQEYFDLAYRLNAMAEARLA